MAEFKNLIAANKHVKKYDSKKTDGREFVSLIIDKIGEYRIDEWLRLIENEEKTDNKDSVEYLDNEWIYADGTIRQGSDFTKEAIKALADKEAYTITVCGLTEGAIYEISEGGVEEVIWPDNVDGAIKEIIDYAKDEMGLPMSETRYSSREVITVWKYWTDKYWTDCGYEYDAGMDYCGILDKNNLYILGNKEKA